MQKFKLVFYIVNDRSEKSRTEVVKHAFIIKHVSYLGLGVALGYFNNEVKVANLDVN